MSDEYAFDPALGGKGDLSKCDRAIAALAARQHGVVARRQLTALDIGSRAIEHRLEEGRLHVVHRGVYAVGHRVLSQRGRWMAAVLAAGPGAALSHRSAAALWGVRQSEGRIEVTVTCNRRSRCGIHMHRGPLPADEVAVVDGIPVTTIPRTLLDLAAVLPLRHVERAINEAEIRRLTDPFSLDALVARYPRRRGVATIKAILADARIGRTITRSDLEVEFQAFLDRYDLPRPEVNAAIEAGGRTLWVDCVWREQRVVVELDSRSIHDTAAAFESDRARDRALQAAGWRVVRVTARHLCREPDLLAADLRAMVTTG